MSSVGVGVLNIKSHEADSRFLSRYWCHLSRLNGVASC